MDEERRHWPITRTISDAEVERRGGFKIDDIETRHDGGMVLRGYTSVFDSLSEWMGFREIVKAGAFKRSLESGKDIKALVEHDPGRIVARTQNGSLELGEDTHGLWVKITPADTTEGRDLVENVRSGLLRQMSIGFRVLEESWSHIDGEDVRTLHQCDLVECSVVADPAYTATSVKVSARSADEGFGDDLVEATECVDAEHGDATPDGDQERVDHSVLRARIALLEIDTFT